MGAVERFCVCTDQFLVVCGTATLMFVESTRGKRDCAATLLQNRSNGMIGNIHQHIKSLVEVRDDELRQHN